MAGCLPNSDAALLSEEEHGFLQRSARNVTLTRVVGKVTKAVLSDGGLIKARQIEEAESSLEATEIIRSTNSTVTPTNTHLTPSRPIAFAPSAEVANARKKKTANADDAPQEVDAPAKKKQTPASLTPKASFTAEFGGRR
ncbi:unnamed protein product [Mesocestoides corti]|uniref:DUF4604 domain-containing protein n=1 Tax=Mesocestoides corti TaxID=53468 RepID=A0A0R3UJG1_MESCO|nr:unnamed protein product [Mesocestoides corti]